MRTRSGDSMWLGNARPPGWDALPRRSVNARLSLLCIIAFAASARSQSPLWAGLEPGPYAVGFKVEWRLDESRTWQPDKDYEGRKLPVEAARPVRISVWYPAQRRAGAPMAYSGYLHVDVPDQR